MESLLKLLDMKQCRIPENLREIKGNYNKPKWTKFSQKNFSRLIEVTKVFSEDFICNFDTSYYPFDLQKCSIIISLKGNTHKFLSLKAGDLTYSGSKQLQTYLVTNITTNTTV